MEDKYIPQNIETKWQQKWEEDGLYRTVEDSDKEKWYALTMLPYPSGDLHLGHWYAMSPSDTRARYKRMQGYNVFFPIGFDAFGLPAENAARNRGIHPYTWTMSNIENMRQQLRSMGAMWAWDREAITCLPGFYKWSEWFFLKFYEMGLAYRAYSPVDWCPSCNTTLAREQVWGEDRHCERCNTPVIRKELEQWFFKITDYADELLDFSQIDWPERVKTMQTNWIGRSEGANVIFKSEEDDEIEVFTTRPDTLWGATFMVLAPEHPLVDKLTTAKYRNVVEDYQKQASKQTEIQRMSADKEKTGVFIGAYAINPVNEERIPIWIADYVMMTYGTGAIMAVPAHDERDFEFAIKFGLSIIPVIDRPDRVAKSVVIPGSMKNGFIPALSEAGIPYETRNLRQYITLKGDEQIEKYIEIAKQHILPRNWCEIVGARWTFVFDDATIDLNSPEADAKILHRCQDIESRFEKIRTTMEMLYNYDYYHDVLFHAEYGTMINSKEFTGTPGDVAKEKVTKWLQERGAGDFAVNYRLRDWLVSRQRYWGCPIPIIYCDECGIVPVPEEDLPVLLPEDAVIPKSGENALKYHEEFLHTTCPQCGGSAKREIDTLDTFICSSWYQYAYVSPYYDGDQPIDPEKGEYWLPVDLYTGGIEHATMHLLYTRFWTKVMRDMGLVDFDEPMLRLYNQGIILGEDHEKMSKSRGNVVAPDNLVQQYGADVVRGYLMFLSRWDEGGPWNSQGIEGIDRFLRRVWGVIIDEPQPALVELADDAITELRRKTHQTIAKVTEDMEAFKFNTMLAALMEFNNYLIKIKDAKIVETEAWNEATRTLMLLIAPSCPHIAEELWTRAGYEYSVHLQSWPTWDPELAKEDTITLVIQINSKVRDRAEVPISISEDAAKELALNAEKIKQRLEGKEVKKVIYVPGKLVNIVAK